MILGSICCRGGSQGVPGKNIRPLAGKPLLVHTIEAARGSRLLEDLLVSTDSERIAEVARGAGVVVPFLRPAHLATAEASKWDVFRHLLEHYEGEHGCRVELLVDMDVTVPLKTSVDIDGAILLALERPALEVVITGYEPERNPYFNMMEIGPDGTAAIVKRSEKPIVRRQDAPVVYSLTPAAYVVRRAALYEHEHWSRARCGIHPMPRERAVDIDSELDFRIVEALLEMKS